MKPAISTRTSESTLPGEDVAMGINDEDMAHVMSLLSSGLYSDPITAFEREYATNAHDAHIEAGVERQIEVTTPTELKPVYTVRDYGIGLSAEEIRTVYLRYGASTKRGTDEQVGMLGLGCKSALGYCDQFTVTAVKAGVRTTVNISRDAAGKGTGRLVEEVPDTDSPTGVTVSVPVKREDVDEVREKALRYFRFWRAGTVLLDGEDPPELGGYELTPDLHVLVHERDAHHDLIVMGNVPYPVQTECLPRGYGHQVVAYVPIGTVEFTPSREALQETDANEAAIGEIEAAFAEAREAAMNKALAAAEDRPTALRTFVETRKALYPGAQSVEASYRGHPVPRHLRYGGRKDRHGNSHRDEMRQLPNEAPYYKHGQSSEYSGIAAEDAMGAIWVLGFNNQTFTKPMRQKLDGTIRERGIEHKGPFVLTPRDYIPMAAWLSGVRTLRWEEVKAFKLPRPVGANAAGESMVGHHEGYTPDGWDDRIPAGDLKDGKRLFYTTGNAASYRELVPKNATIIELTEHRRGRFCRLFPKARQVPDYLRERGQKVWERATEQQHAAWSYQRPRNFDCLDVLDPERIDDPELAAEVRLYRAEGLERLEAWEIWLPERRGSTQLWNEDAPEVLRRYPLLEHGAGSADHLHFYVNAAFAAQQEGST